MKKIWEVDEPMVAQINLRNCEMVIVRIKLDFRRHGPDEIQEDDRGYEEQRELKFRWRAWRRQENGAKPPLKERTGWPLSRNLQVGFAAFLTVGNIEPCQ